MAEKIIPFARTLLLPAGSPAIGCVDGVRMDVSGLQCQATGQACYCLGDADVLIEYHAAPADSGSLFGAPSAPGRAWQALLSLPVELVCGSGEELSALPPGCYQPLLRHLEWFMVASNAVELEGSLLLRWEEEEAVPAPPIPAPEEEEDLEAGSEAEPEAGAEAEAAPEPTACPEVASVVEQPEQQEDALPEPAEEAAPRGLIWRPERTGKGKQAYQSRGWTMVNYTEEQTAEKHSTVEEQIQHLADSAEQTVAEARQLWKEIEQRQAEQGEAEPEEEAPPDMEKTKAPAAPIEAEASPPAVTLAEEQLREVVSLSLSGEMETDAEEEPESELREGVVVRMRFDPPASQEQKRLYYPGPVPEQSTDPEILAETLREALGEEMPRPSARLSFSWDKEAEAEEAASGGEDRGADREAAPPLQQAEVLSVEDAAEAAFVDVQEEPMLQAEPVFLDAEAEAVPEAEPERAAAAPVNDDPPVQEAAAEQREEAALLKKAESEQEAGNLQEKAQAATSANEPDPGRKQPGPLPAEPVQATETALPQQSPVSQPEPPRVEAELTAVEESLDAALEPEILPPAEKRSRRRRAVGLPRLHIDARDNTVEISAFNLQIKL